MGCLLAEVNIKIVAVVDSSKQYYAVVENALTQPTYDEVTGFQGSPSGMKVTKMQIYHGNSAKNAV